MGLKHFFRCISKSLRSLTGGKAARRQLQHSRDYNSPHYHSVMLTHTESAADYDYNYASGASSTKRRSKSGRGLRRMISSRSSNGKAFDRELEERISVTTARMEDIRRQTFIGSPASPVSPLEISSSNDDERLIECVPGTSIPLCDTGDAEEVVKVYARLMAAKREFEIAEQELKQVKDQAEHVVTHGRRSASKLPPVPPHFVRPKPTQPRSTWI